MAPRPEHTRIGTLELDEDVIAVRTHQRLPASELFTAVTLERSQQRRRLGRLSHRAAIAQLDLVTFPGETRIDTADLRLQSRRRPSPPIDQLHADFGKLFVPGPELGVRAGATPLEHGVPAREDLPEAPHRCAMTRVEPCRDAVKEIAA